MKEKPEEFISSPRAAEVDELRSGQSDAAFAPDADPSVNGSAREAPSEIGIGGRGEPENIPSSRSCGSCYACCIWLGIEELKKHTGQSCRYLTGINGPTHRCGIYPTRPKACSNYQCAWLEGLGPDAARPDKSGLLVTPYPDENGNGPFSVTIIVIDSLLSGTITTGYLGQFIEALLIIGCNEIRVTNHKDKTVIHFHNGEVRNGKLLKGRTFEEFVCQTEDPPIAHYKTFKDSESAEKWKNENLKGKVFS